MAANPPKRIAYFIGSAYCEQGFSPHIASPAPDDGEAQARHRGRMPDKSGWLSACCRFLSQWGRSNKSRHGLVSQV